MIKTEICAGIVTFNPDLIDLRKNIEAITEQVGKVIIVDNGSSNTREIDKLISKYTNIQIEYNDVNLGIARALNQLLDIANKNKYKWILTLDQDSICFPNIIQKMLKYINLPNAGMITAAVIDEGIGKLQYSEQEISVIQYCITAGCLTNIDICRKLGGFDEKMFIDSVDHEMCLRLTARGYKIYQLNVEGIKQKIGYQAHVVNILNKKIVIFNHSSKRTYYIVRNNIYVARKYKRFLGKRYYRKLLTSINKTIEFVLFENNKLEKIRMCTKGLIDG